MPDSEPAYALSRSGARIDGRKLVGHQRVRPIAVIAIESIRVAHRTETDDPRADDRQLGASSLFDDRQRHTLKIISVTFRTSWRWITHP